MVCTEQLCTIAPLRGKEGILWRKQFQREVEVKWRQKKR